MRYSDYIAHLIKKFLSPADSAGEQMLQDVSQIHWDLTPDGTFLSTKKTIFVTDEAGNKYRITVEEV